MPAQGCEGGRELCVFLTRLPLQPGPLFQKGLNRASNVSGSERQGRFPGRGDSAPRLTEGQRAVSVRLGSYSGWVFLEGQVPQRSSGR